MFRKAQLRFFAIIESILLALFIALLTSINLIMEAAMQRQSKVVLEQIAAGVEYDGKTQMFTFTPQDGFNDDRHQHEPPPTTEKTEAKTTEPTTEAAAATETTTAASDTTSMPATEEITDEVTYEDETEYEVQEDPTEPVYTEPPATQVQPKQTSTQPVRNPADPPQQNTTQPQSPPKKEDTPKPDREDTTKPHIGPEKPDEHADKDDNNNQNNDGWNDWQNGGWYTRPEDYWWWWNNPPQPYVGDADEYRFADRNDNTESSDDCCEKEQADVYGDTAAGLVQTAGNGMPVLDGFTVIVTPPHTYSQPKYEADRREPEPVPKSLGSIDFFIVMTDENGKFLSAMNNEELSEETAQQYIDAIFNDGATSGMVNSLQFCRSTKPNGTLLVFTDKTAEIEWLGQLNRTTILIGAVAFIVLSALAYYFSKKSIEPLHFAFDKQKQFISDASHELKTPLTVISANADVLAGEIGNNKWLTYIQSQTDRMNVLVNDLLNLTRLENNAADFVRTDFSLSQAVTNTALPFECQAFESNKTFEVDVEDGITVNGSERHIKQMTAIFIDNALKYSGENGTVRISLRRQGDKSILTVFNTGNGIKNDEADKIFERFYRSDDSRCRATGGYGLGLAIAKSIIDKHKFKVSVDNHEGESIAFVVTMQHLDKNNRKTLHTA